ncbi:EAL domain-containing protein [Pseudoxanthomonas composti]|uniref:EAL domain-containing protein n=1 Tax=Pseudoxanthomonas composti TaxID=2137479 RepID=A0A4Q1JRC8_9GAMM|nr:EAL domain-containing protein [Pseudoxanthomonas composti]
MGRHLALDQTQQALCVSPGQRLLSALEQVLPAGTALAVAWQDPVLGRHAHASQEASAGLAQLADDLLASRQLPAAAADGSMLHLWCDARGEACMALALLPPRDALLPSALGERVLAMAAKLFELALEHDRARARIASLEKSKQLQQALYEIADLAGADLEMQEMLRRLHRVIATLMYAENCYIVVYDDRSRTMRFLYFADQQDDYVADPERAFAEEDMPNSMTFALLRHGQPLRGPSEVLRQQLRIEAEALHGPDSLDWLGVPMRREDRVVGAIVVQSYDTPVTYTDEDRALLSYVAQHILVALERRQAHDALEQRIAQRTAELQRANAELQSEVVERVRAETLQKALYRITERSVTCPTQEDFYREVHGVVGGLMNARNFYIALVSEDGTTLHFVYSVDERDSMRVSRPLGRGVTEYVIRDARPMLASWDEVKALVARGEIQQGGSAPAHSWLGAPLLNGEDAFGAVVVQSYSPEESFTPDDLDLLVFVAHHLANGVARQRGQARLREAHSELEARVRARTYELAEANNALLQQISERMRAEQRLLHQATHDALTGLPNRAHLADKLTAAVEAARLRPEAAFAVLFLDLDRFKVVNDSIGHAAGDEMLMEVARRIIATADPNDVVARLGGDEFAIIAWCGAATERASVLAEQLLVQLGRPMQVAGRELFPAASIGIAHWHRRYSSGDELLRDADAAMYRAKAQGRDRSAVFDQVMRETALHSLELEADLRRAIIHDEFVPHYQPIVDMTDGRVIGHEALLRWQHERRGLLAPDAFIALGEDSGLIEQVDWLMYAQVVRRLAQQPKGYLSVNVSPRHFSSADFAERLLDLCRTHGADPAQLRLEITEVALLDDAPRTLRSLRTLREHGVLAQLDDFGTGFSALSYLHRFPLSVLKIDRSFVSGLDSDQPESFALVRAILALANTLGIETIAEGVETEHQRRALLGLGCRRGQGYLFGRPAPQLVN